MRRLDTMSDLIALEVPLLPLYEQHLGHHQRGDQDQHHLGVHGLVPAVLLMQTLVLHSDTIQ